MLDIGTGELIALAVLALLVLGPDKLPRYAADAARFLRQLRTLANDAKSEVQKELGPELDGLGLREINPRALVRKHVLDGLDGFGDTDGQGQSASRPAPPRRAGPPASPGAAPYDPDTT